MADITSYVLGYAVSCASRNLSYMHYCMNYGRSLEMTDYFKLTAEQYNSMLVALSKAGKTEH